jgi:hypothetical protein
MSTYAKLAAEAGDQYLTFLAEAQEQFLKIVGTTPAWAAAIPAIPAMATPAGVDIPTPKEIVEASFSFTTKFVKQQKAFSEKLLSAMTPEKEK